MPLKLGTAVRDRYRIYAALSEHANGGVYRAHDLETDRPCIVKEFLSLTTDEFEPAAQALRHRIHPTLPEVYDYFSLDEDRHCLVMEYVEGESLAARLARDGPLPERQAASWLGQVLAALDYLHSRNPPVLHGDVKPANVLITPEQDAVLVDYGIQQRLNPHTPATLAAPEQIAGRAEPRSDVYAAGATLYMLLTGQIPGETQDGLADRFAIESPRTLSPALSPAMARVAEKAMARKPEARYESIREMRKALGRAGSRTPPSDEAAEAEDTSKQTRPTPRRRVSWRLSAAVVVVAGVAGILLWLQPFGPGSVQPQVTITRAALAEPPAPTPLPTRATVGGPTATRHPTATATSTEPASSTPAPTATEPLPTPSVAPTLGVGSTAQASVDAAVLVYVPGGEFIVGSTFDDPLSFADEFPQHMLELAAFWIDQTEVTNAQYRKCVAAGACTEPAFNDSATRPDYYQDTAFDNFPVVWVDWFQAQAYCQWAGRRLPQEAEWEKAARGSTGRIFPWGDELGDEPRANFNTVVGDTTATGSYPDGASPYGALDMAGNVAEWVADYYRSHYFNHTAHLTATPEATALFRGGVRALRNGAWNDNLANIRAASRRFAPSNEYYANNVGFRCATTVVP